MQCARLFLSISFKYLVASIWHRNRGHYQIIETAIDAQGKHLAHLACEYEEEDWINHEIVYVLHPETIKILGQFEGYQIDNDALSQAQEWTAWRLGYERRSPAKKPSNRPYKPKITHSTLGEIDLNQFDGYQTESAHEFSGATISPDPMSELFNSLSE